MTEAIGKLPKGTWTNTMRVDGYEAPLDLVASVTIGEDTIHVDFTGTSGMSTYAINCPLCYTEAYTTFGINCVVAPTIPNNAGTLAAVKVTAPPGTIVSATYPAAVYARSSIGHMMPDVVYGALEQAIPGRVPAEGTSNLWSLKMIAGHGLTGVGDKAGTQFMVMSFHSGGAGARPAAGRAVGDPVPVRRAQRSGGSDRGDHAAGHLAQGAAPGFRRRRAVSRRPGPGDGGRLPRGRGVRPVRRLRTGEVSRPRPQRRRRRAVRGGVAEVRQELKPKGLQVVPAGERLVIEMPGGGGMGPPAERDPEAVRRDVRLGYLSAEAAKRQYGIEPA